MNSDQSQIMRIYAIWKNTAALLKQLQEIDHPAKQHCIKILTELEQILADLIYKNYQYQLYTYRGTKP